jgi:hypothetical protein
MSTDGTKVQSFKIYLPGSYQDETVTVTMRDLAGNSAAVYRETSVHFANKEYKSGYYEVMGPNDKPIILEDPTQLSRPLAEKIIRACRLASDSGFPG